MADQTMLNEFPDAAQRRAVCQHQVDGKADLPLTASFSVEAAATSADGKPRNRRFTMVAYTGGRMRIAGFTYPVVVDLGGLDLSRSSFPVYIGHNQEAMLGQADRVEVVGANLVVSGDVIDVSPKAKEAVEAHDRGFRWQASIGAAVLVREFVPEGRNVNVNGNSLAGPLIVARKAELGEISFVYSGADRNTSATIAAGNAAKESTVMATENINTAVQGEEAGKVQAQTLGAPDGVPAGADGGGSAASAAADLVPDIRAEAIAEIKRIDSIHKVCNSGAVKHADIEAQAIEGGWDVARTELEVLRAERPKAPVVTVTAERSPVLAVEAGLCLRATKDATFIEAQYGRDVLAGAERFRRMSIVQAAAACLRADGLEPDMDGVAVVRAALSTTSFPALLSNVANKALLKAYQDYPSTALRWCGTGDLPDFKAQTRARLNLSGSLQEIGPDGEPKHLTASDESATVRLKTQALAFSVSRSDLINDDLGAITRAPAGFGAICRRKIDDLVYTKLLANKLSDGASDLFSSGNENYISGATTVLSAEGLRKGLETFRKQTDAVGNAIGLEPRFLLVPPELEFVAKQLVNSASLQHVGASTAADKNNPTYNPFQGAFEVIVEPRLSNSTLAGYSLTAWYLACDSALADTIEVDFLNGQRAPTITRVGNGSILKVEYEVVFDVEANVVDFRGMVKSKGAA